MVEPMQGSMRESLSVLKLPDYRRLWFAQTISVIGDQIFPIAATISVLDSGGNASDVGLVLGARFAAIVVFALIGGVWADRLPRKLVMVGADLFRAAAVGSLVVLPGSPSVGLLIGIVFLVGAGEAFFRPAEAALLPRIVPVESRAAANGLMSIAYRSSAVLGPGLGGVLVASLDSSRLAFAVNSATFLLSALFLWGMREPAREQVAKEDRESFLVDLREGLAAVREQRWIAATITGGAFLLMFCLAPMEVLLPIIGRREFDTDTVYATSLALFSLGGVVGALIAIRFTPRHPGRIAWLGGLLFGLVPLSLMFPTSVWTIYVAHFVGGLSWEPFAVYWPTAMQREIAPEKLARVTSIDWMASFSLMPVGFALTGPVVASIGEDAVLGISIVALFAICLPVLLVPGVRDFKEPRLQPAGKQQ